MNTNPLKQYFRRPAIYLKLPSGGKFYPEGAIELPDNQELPVYPMTAIDEITSKTPDALFNGDAIVQIIKSCVPNIKDPWKILSNDLDSILIAIRAAGGQDTIDVESECPNCQALGTYGINLQTLLASLKPGDYHKILEYGELKIKFKPLHYKEMNEAGLGQFEIQAKYKNLSDIKDVDERNRLSQEALKDITILTMKILAKAVEHIQTPNAVVTEVEFIEDFLTNADTKTYETIRDYHSALRAESTIKPLEITCVECQHEYKQSFSLNVSDFFG